MIAVTILALSWVAWQRWPVARPEPLALGRKIPALKLVDPFTGAPISLPPTLGKVTWITLWSIESKSGQADLDRLEKLWNRFQIHDRFAMAAIAIDSAHPEPLRKALADSGSLLPTYLCDPSALGAFGINASELPLHLVLDETGRLIAISKGDGSIDALADQVEARLELLEVPKKNRRFAFIRP
jgi:hypothetical protein